MRQHIVFGPWNPHDYKDKYTEVALLDNILWDAGYWLSDSDIYKAWLTSNDYVWEHPNGYTDEEIVDCILTECSLAYMEIEPPYSSGVPTPTWGLTDEDLLNLEEDMENYDPKYEPRSEGKSW